MPSQSNNNRGKLLRGEANFVEDERVQLYKLTLGKAEPPPHSQAMLLHGLATS